ncbi:MAG: CHAT domain-containing protein [Candidatus Obscuribacterales bacterium]|nr:CHAT domain-containing protein [Candidatus Obscuribacterales bacterium]
MNQKIKRHLPISNLPVLSPLVCAAVIVLVSTGVVRAEERGGTLPSANPKVASTVPTPATASESQQRLDENQAKDIAKIEERWLPRTKKGKPEERSDALYNLGKALFEVRAYDLAEKYLLESLALESTLKRSESMAMSKLALGHILVHKNDLNGALVQYQAALDEAEKSNLQEYIGVLTDTIGSLYWKIGKLDEADKWYKKAYVLAEKNNQIPTMIISLINQSTIARKRGDKEAARPLLLQAVGLAKKTDPGRDVGNAIMNLARLQHDTSNIPDSIAMYKRAIEIFHEEMDNEQEASACLNVGENSYDLNDPATARKYYLQGIEVLKDEPPSKVYVSLLTGLGVAEAELGNFAASEQHHKLAIETARQLKLKEAELEALLHFGTYYLLKGEAEGALQKLLEGEKLIGGSSLNIATRIGFLIGIGRSYKVLGETEAAMKYYNEALQLSRDIGDKTSEARVLTTIAVLQFDAKNLAQADVSYKEARKIYESLDDKRNVAMLDYNEAQLMVTQNKNAEALILYRQALANLKDSGDKITEGMVLRGLGFGEYASGHWQKSLAYFQEALKSAEEAETIEALWDSNLGLGKCYKKLGLNDLALTHLEKAAGLVEKERQQLTRDSFKTYNLDFRNDCFAELLDLYVSQGKPYEALEVAEKGRARAFLDMLSSRKAGKIGIETFKAPLSSKAEPIKPDPVQVAQAEPGSRAVSVMPRASQIFSSTALSPVNAAPPNIDEIKQLVQNSKSTVLEYFLLKDKLIAWVIDPDATIHMLPPIPLDKEKLQVMVADTYKAITAQPKDKAELEVLGKRREALLREMYMMVLAPCESRLPKDPNAVVTIVPHGPMFSIPFAALIGPDGSYFVEKHTLAYTPAIGVWRATQKLDQVAQKEKNRLLAFGNPITAAIAFLGKLPYAEREVQNIATIFGKESSVVKIGQDANKKVFAELAPQFTDVHLATHGLVDEEHPMNSSVVLAPTAYDDGLLSVSDIINMKELKARLVVLSACQTGRGKITGDGVVGLSRAFIIAGAPSVMVSQWNVDDIMTEFQMKAFYKGYLAGSAKSRSLRDAQLATIKFMEGGGTKNTLRANPRYWAAFQLMGQAL